jgi:hypothetical protein
MAKQAKEWMMREEIEQALTVAQQARSSQPDWAAQLIRADPIPPGDYSSMLLAQQRHNLEHVFQTIDVLKRCLSASAHIASVEPGTTTSVEVYVGQLETYAVIELSLYGSLAALFPYGSVPQDVIEHIEHCLVTNGRTLLTETERQTLEARGVYHDLF